MNRIVALAILLGSVLVACAPTGGPASTTSQPTNPPGVLYAESDGPVNLAAWGGPPTVLAALTLPSGKWLVEAKTNLIVSAEAQCRLIVDGQQRDIAWPGGGSHKWVYPSFVTMVDTASQAAVSLECVGQTATDNASQTRLVATRAS